MQDPREYMVMEYRVYCDKNMFILMEYCESSKCQIQQYIVENQNIE